MSVYLTEEVSVQLFCVFKFLQLTRMSSITCAENRLCQTQGHLLDAQSLFVYRCILNVNAFLTKDQLLVWCSLFISSFLSLCIFEYIMEKTGTGLQFVYFCVWFFFFVFLFVFVLVFVFSYSCTPATIETAKVQFCVLFVCKYDLVF